ncbi:MAG TPA: Uma2 family endonuclease [Chthonomonadaceae bacterium]|nr:Uma2 family endonuclease [Chthonomonadaceae bacterium]
MPRTLTPADIPPPPETAPNRIRWTRQQCEAIRDTGILTGRYELIDGEIISKMGQKPSHAYVVNLVMSWLIRLFGVEFVRIQSTIDLAAISPDYDEPEPDAAVTAQPVTAYAERHPAPADLLLVVEVSDTTLRFDRTTKAALYARAGIREYWVVDILGRQAFVHRQPTSDGYGEVTAYGAEESAVTLARPDAPVRVADLLPPA